MLKSLLGAYCECEEADEPLESRLETLISLIVDRLDTDGDRHLNKAEVAKMRQKKAKQQAEMVSAKGPLSYKLPVKTKSDAENQKKKKTK